MSVASVRRIRIDSRRRWVPDLSEFYRYRQLVFLLGRRDITVRYRQTVLGSLWIFAGPLISAGLFSFVFGRVANLESGGIPYFVFSYAGLLGWNVFSGTLSGASTSLTNNTSLLTKIYFPHLIIPLSTLASVLVNTGVSFCVMLFLLLVSGVGISVQIVLLPFWLFLAMTLAMGLSLAFTSLSVSYRDVNYLTPLLTQLLLFLSPVAYSLDAVPPDLRTLYLLNPIATIVEGCRWSLLGTSFVPPAWALAYTIVLTFGVFVGGLLIFSRREGIVADVI